MSFGRLRRIWALAWDRRGEGRYQEKPALKKRFHKTLAAYIRDFDAGGSANERLDQLASEIRAHLELWRRLDSMPKAEPNPSAQERGHEMMLAELARLESRRSRSHAGAPFFGRAASTVAATLVALLLIAGGVAGASAALGGPNVASEVLSGMGIRSAPDTGQEPDNSEASEGSENAGQGREDASGTGQEHANPNASEGSENAGQGRENASETGQQNSNPKP